jgi:hypothetical protein
LEASGRLEDAPADDPSVNALYTKGRGCAPVVSPPRSPTSPLEVFFVVLRGDRLERDLLACHPGRSSSRRSRAIQFCPKNEIVRILPLRGLAGSTRLEAEPVRPSHPEEVAHLCLITPSILASSVGRFHSDDCP